MNSPKLITTEVRKLNPALLGTREEFDAFAQRMLEREREALLEMAEMACKADQYDQRMAFADLEADAALESRVHHNTRPNRKTD